MKKMFTALFTVLLCLVMAVAVSFAENTDPVIAEGVGQTEHGYTLDVLYQEHTSGKVSAYLAFHGYGEGSGQIVVYNGTVSKEVDEDGDPIVVVNFDEIPVYVSNDGIGDTMNYTYGPQTTNTYDESTGAYSIPLNFSMFGYADLAATIDVAAVDSASDVSAWFAQYDLAYGEASEPVTDAEGAVNAADAEAILSFEGGYTTFHCYANGTYIFEFPGMVTEQGNWTWKDWTFTVTTAGGNEIVATMNDETHALEFTYVADINPQLQDNFTCASIVWSQVLDVATGAYTPAE